MGDFDIKDKLGIDLFYFDEALEVGGVVKRSPYVREERVQGDVSGVEGERAEGGEGDIWSQQCRGD